MKFHKHTPNLHFEICVTGRLNCDVFTIYKNEPNHFDSDKYMKLGH